jgi:hypothetical protein
VPKCYFCDNRVSADELVAVGWEFDGDVPKMPKLACPECRTPKEVTRMENTTPKSTRKPIANLTVYEEAGDYSFELNVKVGGVNIQIERTMDQVRSFFSRGPSGNGKRLPAKDQYKGEWNKPRTPIEVIEPE